MNLPGEDYLNGRLVAIDKPLRWTSFDVVNKMRYALKRHYGLKKIKVGHAGTLDPLATGLVLVATGKMTRQLDSVMGLPKEYSGCLHLGATTPSYDLETEVNGYFPTTHINQELVEATLPRFTGTIVQMPPQYSALKIKGQKAYEAARKGSPVALEARKIEIFNLEITRYEFPDLFFKVRCSKGTYIRSLAYDLGRALGSGAYLAALRRTHIGSYSVENALGPEEWVQQLELS